MLSISWKQIHQQVGNGRYDVDVVHRTSKHENLDYETQNRLKKMPDRPILGYKEVHELADEDLAN